MSLKPDFAARLLTALIFVIWPTVPCRAEMNTLAEPLAGAFSRHPPIQSEFFEIYLQEGVQIEELRDRLTLPMALDPLILRPVAENPESLAEEVDKLFLVVSNLLDLHLWNFRSTIKVYLADQNMLELLHRQMGLRELSDGFYFGADNAVFINAETVNFYVLGHEISHAIQHTYFGFSQPEKHQEILSGYVEYQLRKYTETLPERENAPKTL